MNLNPALPQQALLAQQSEWLAPARSRLLRRVGIAHRNRILDFGSGYGSVTGELDRRSSGIIVALDINYNSLCEEIAANRKPIHPVNGDAQALPFSDNSFDLIFCQCSLMWFGNLETAVQEIHRTLQPGGVLVALEPDYGGLIEHPAQLTTRHLWLSALSNAGADPFTGRKLLVTLAQNNMTTRINFFDQLQPPSDLRFEFLEGLPLTAEEQQQLIQIKKFAAATPVSQQIAHLPFFLITAEKSKKNTKVKPN